MEAEIFEYGFKLLVGISIPYAVKSLSDIRKSMEGLNTKIAVLIEKDANKDKELDEQAQAIKYNATKMSEMEKQIIKLQMAIKGIKND